MEKLLYEKDLPDGIWFEKLPKKEWNFIRKIRDEIQGMIKDHAKEYIIQWVSDKIVKKYKNVSCQYTEGNPIEEIYKISFGYKYHIFIVFNENSVEIVPMGVASWELKN